jgi:hypothetical protein
MSPSRHPLRRSRRSPPKFSHSTATAEFSISQPSTREVEDCFRRDNRDSGRTLGDYGRSDSVMITETEPYTPVHFLILVRIPNPRHRTGPSDDACSGHPRSNKPFPLAALLPSTSTEKPISRSVEHSAGGLLIGPAGFVAVTSFTSLRGDSEPKPTFLGAVG